MELFFINGVPLDHAVDDASRADHGIRFNDRALQYGDGVFETLRIVDGCIPMWEFHQQRLIWAQHALKLPLDLFLSRWQMFVQQHLADVASGCAKLVISRGCGPRGYKIPNDSRLNWWLQVNDFAPRKNVTPFHLTLCQHTLSRQPVLAGLKHLNRLDQVIARSEWGDEAGFDEGIMFNLDGDVVEGTMSNVFWLSGDQLFTPDLSQEGIDGCVRRWLIADPYELLTSPVIIKKAAKLDELLSADAVFLTNSLLGIQSVQTIAGHAVAQSAWVDTLAKAFNDQFSRS